jgi:hypothetical protein
MSHLNIFVVKLGGIIIHIARNIQRYALKMKANKKIIKTEEQLQRDKLIYHEDRIKTLEKSIERLNKIIASIINKDDNVIDISK